MSADPVVIIDGGGANIASLTFALERLGRPALLTTDHDRIRQARHVILPGVGAAGAAMARLASAGLDRLIPTLTQPLLGICLGMQLLYERSEEGDTDCLGIVPATVGRLLAAPGLPVPHMGWNRLHIRRADPLLDGLADGAHLYFVHGYAAPVTEDTLAGTDYGMPLTAVVRRRNFAGTQFHPERSGPAGARVLANFLLETPCC